MKRLRTKLVLLAIVGMLTLSITVASTQGWWRTFNLRPIDDWMANNPWGSSPGWGLSHQLKDGGELLILDQ